MRFLKETRNSKEENNVYPFLHLLPDGNLFIFANSCSIMFDYKEIEFSKVLIYSRCVSESIWHLCDSFMKLLVNLGDGS